MNSGLCQPRVKRFKEIEEKEMSPWFNPGRSSALNLRKNFWKSDFPPCPLHSSEGTGKSASGFGKISIKEDFYGIARREICGIWTQTLRVLQHWPCNGLPRLETPQKGTSHFLRVWRGRASAWIWECQPKPGISRHHSDPSSSFWSHPAARLAFHRNTLPASGTPACQDSRRDLGIGACSSSKNSCHPQE